MLRAAVIVLLLANALVFAWSRGWLAPVLALPGAGEREPDRLLQQVRPESIVVLGPKAAAQAASKAAESAAGAPASGASTPP